MKIGLGGPMEESEKRTFTPTGTKLGARSKLFFEYVTLTYLPVHWIRIAQSCAWGSTKP